MKISEFLQKIADAGDLSSVFQFLESNGGYTHLDHWQQGEFHHDHLLEINPNDIEKSVLVIATNCNGAVKEIVHLSSVPDRWELWGWRVPENPEFEKSNLAILTHIKTVIWFDPRRLLTSDTRSELLPEHRRRQRGGGWVSIDSEDDA